MSDTPKADFLALLSEQEGSSADAGDRGEALSAVFQRATKTLEWVRAHQTGVVVDVRSDVAMPGTDLTIRRGRSDEWGGSFNSMLGEMLILAVEDDTTAVTILAHPDAQADELNLYRGVVHSFDTDEIQMFDGARIARDNVIAMGV